MSGLRTLSHPSGVELDLTEFGAQVMGWRVGGVEHLYASPLVDYASGKPLRGGVPICFPQFNARVIEGRALPKHGFARTAAWQWASNGFDELGVWAKLVLSQADLTDEIQDAWPFAFLAECLIRASATALRVEVAVSSRSDTDIPFALALHTYLRVSDIETLRLHGLRGANYWDAVADSSAPDQRHQDSHALSFGAQTDRVYASAPRSLRIADGHRDLRISASESLPDTVVWNPGPELCARLEDLPADGWRHMLCVEAAAIEKPVRLAPGQTWRGWQELSLD